MDSARRVHTGGDTTIRRSGAHGAGGNGHSLAERVFTERWVLDRVRALDRSVKSVMRG